MFVVVKLVSGAELIAEMTSSTETSIVLKNPLQVVYSSSSFGIPAVTVQKFCPFAKQEIYNLYYIENANAGEKALLLRQAMPVTELFRLARGG